VLLSHGAAIVLSDRLVLSSDLDSFCCCYLCGSILGLMRFLFLFLLLMLIGKALGSQIDWNDWGRYSSGCLSGFCS